MGMIFPRLHRDVIFGVRSLMKPFNRLNNTSSFYFDYERIRGTENARWLELTGKQAIEKFLPVSRKPLLRTILGDVNVIRADELNDFQKVATRIDSALYVRYKKELDALKSLYNPLSPDRETVQLRSFSSKQLIHRETKILKKLSALLAEASFFELPKGVMLDALREDNLDEKIIVTISPENYETLKFWVIGMDVVPIDDQPWNEMTKTMTNLLNQRSRRLDPLAKIWYEKTLLTQISSKLQKKLYGENTRRIARYKRVIVAVRMKKDAKLIFKAFKDIPCENLEFLLPENRIKMKNLDRIRMFLQSCFMILFVLCTTLTNIVELRMEMNLALGLLIVIILIRNATVYKNLRNRCILDLSQTLYFKSVASNHALLALIADRAEDETYKSAVLCYAFLHKMKSHSPNSCSTRTTESELKNEIEEWLEGKFSIKVNLSIRLALSYLEELKLINSRSDDNEVTFQAIPLKATRTLLPVLERPPLLHQADLLNINIERDSAVEKESETAYLNYEGRYDWK